MGFVVFFLIIFTVGVSNLVYRGLNDTKCLKRKNLPYRYIGVKTVCIVNQFAISPDFADGVGGFIKSITRPIDNYIYHVFSGLLGNK